SVSSSAIGEYEYRSISTIQEETPARWIETYKTKWRTIEVDVSIEVPVVDQFPVIQIKQGDILPTDLFKDYEYIHENRKGSFVAAKDKEHADTFFDFPIELRQKVLGIYHNGEEPNVQPENNHFNYQDALDYSVSEICRLCACTSDELQVFETKVTTGYYRSKYKNMHERIWYEYVTGIGEYEFKFRQLFHGISMETAMECYSTACRRNEAALGLFPHYFVNITDRNSFMIWGNHYKETRIKYEDIPIISFYDAKEAIEAEIMSGHLRSIDTVKLCYIPYIDKADNSVVWLLPGWYVSGGYTRNASKEFEPYYNDNGEMVDDGIERRPVVFEANIGELIDYNANGRSRRHVPNIYTWDDLGFAR
ncbi:MAG: hypothetical protein RSE58_06995, partial [Clostridia bacterium]